jgi:hypothetical protein
MKFLASSLTALTLFLPLTATADPIRVTRSLTMGIGGTLVLEAADRDFHLTAAVSVVEHRFDPFTAIPFLPGEEIPLSAFFASPTFIGTLAGEEVRGGPITGLASEFRFGGSVLTPALVGTAATLTGPFTFSGRIFDIGLDLAGSGLAALHLARAPDQPFWAGFSSPSVYQFDSVEPIPEPGTLLLVASGVVLSVRRLRRHAAHVLHSRCAARRSCHQRRAQGA